MTASEAPLRPGRFAIDGLAGTYNGFTTGERWNGWSVPHFPLAEAQRIAADYAAQPADLAGPVQAEYDSVRDVVRIYDPVAEEWDEYGAVEMEDGTPLYSVAARYWTWEEIDAE